jgi:hypothetical protein
VDKGERSREEVLMEVFDHKKVPVDVDLGFAVEETGGARREALQFSPSAAHQLSSVKGSSPSKGPPVALGLKMVQTPSHSLVFSLRLLQWHRILLRAGRAPISVLLGAVTWDTRWRDGTANKAVHVCLRDERGLDNVLPARLASGCQALPSAATAYTG